MIEILKSILDQGVMPEHVLAQARSHLVELHKLRPNESTTAEEIETALAETQSFIDDLEREIGV